MRSPSLNYNTQSSLLTPTSGILAAADFIRRTVCIFSRSFPPELDLTMEGVLVRCAAADLGVQWFGWALAAALRTEKFYDLAGNTNTLTLPAVFCWCKDSCTGEGFLARKVLFRRCQFKNASCAQQQLLIVKVLLC